MYLLIDLSPCRAPGTVFMIKSSFTDTLPEPWRVPVGARPAIGRDLTSFRWKRYRGPAGGRRYPSWDLSGGRKV